MAISGKTRFYSFWPIFWCFKTMRNLVCFLIVHLKNQLLLPAFGTKMTHFFGVFCYEPPGKWSKKWSKKWSFLTLFLTHFWTPFWPPYLCVSYSTRHLRVYLGKTWKEGPKRGPKSGPKFNYSHFQEKLGHFSPFLETPAEWPSRVTKSGQKRVKKWVKKWSFLGHFCHVLPSKLGNLGTPKSGQKWPKMAYFWSFLTTFLTTLFVYVLF